MISFFLWSVRNGPFEYPRVFTRNLGHMYTRKQRKNLFGALLPDLRIKILQKVGSILRTSFREKIIMIEGKEEFYKKAEEALKSRGYQYYGEKDIAGIGSGHSSKPDYIAVKGNTVVIGEIKSPKEGPKSSMWRQIQKGDSEEFKAVRLDVARREEAGELPKEVGGHEIIIRGQIPDYISKRGRTYNFPPAVRKDGRLMSGYTFPDYERRNVEQAMKNCRKAVYEVIDTRNCSITFIFDSLDR